MQGFAVDGRKVPRLEVSLQVRGQNIRPGQSAQELAALVITFYDENRATIGQGIVGPWRGTFPWQKEVKQIDVPLRAREAIVRIGLFGGVGEVSFDAVEIRAVRK